MTRTGQKPMPNLWFRLMALEYRTRSRPSFVVERVRGEVAPGMQVLDFGCGPGRYTLLAASIVGARGVVHALDMHPLAIRTVERAAKRQGLANVRLIHSSGATGLEPRTIDVAFLFDTLHDVEDTDGVLQELRRVLKPKGRLLYMDHTLNGAPLHQRMQRNGFCLVEASEVSCFERC